MGQVLKVFQDNYAVEAQRANLRLLSIAFEDKREVLQLQAADLLAYELHKHLLRQLGHEQRPTRYTLKKLAELPRAWVRVDAVQMRQWHFVIDRGLYHSLGTWSR